MAAAPKAISATAHSDHELVAAVRRGDDRAFEELYGRYRARISAFIAGMCGDYARAEDLAQEVFISALRRLRDTERPVAFKPWIYEIAKNACIDEFRRTRRAREVSLDADEDGHGESGTLPSPAGSPDAAIERKQSLTDLQGAFRGLSDNHHKILIMREFEGLSYEQIAERLDMSLPMVESTLFRARKRLSEEYDDLVTGRRCLQVQGVIDECGGRAVRKLGIRQRRLLARHLAHCQPCRRHAHLAGFEAADLRPTGLVEKIAVLLPFPFLRWRRGNGSASASHSVAAMQSLPSLAGLAAAPATMEVGRAAAAVAAVVVAGVGAGGIITAANDHAGRAPSHPPARVAAARVRTQTAQAASARHQTVVQLPAHLGGSSPAGHGAAAPVRTHGSRGGGASTSAPASAGSHRHLGGLVTKHPLGGVAAVVGRVVAAAGVAPTATSVVKSGTSAAVKPVQHAVSVVKKVAGKLSTTAGATSSPTSVSGVVGKVVSTVSGTPSTPTVSVPGLPSLHP